MLTLTFFLSFLFISVRGMGQLVILEHPSSIEFLGSEEIDVHTIPDLFAASLGFTVKTKSNWPGMTIKNPFGYAQSLVVVAVEGVSTLGNFPKLPVYPVSPTQEEFKSWRIIQDYVEEHFPSIDSKTLSRVELGSEINDVDLKLSSTTYLDKSNFEDGYFLQDIDELKKITKSFKNKKIGSDGIPEVTWIVLSSLHALSDVRGDSSDATLEAKQMLSDELTKLGEAVKIATNGRCLVATVVSDVSHTRQGRSIVDSVNGTAPGNRATVYSEDYPAIFNIILWFAVTFIFALIATSYFIATMDPGRDSIIYRMTSNRMKKDS